MGINQTYRSRDSSARRFWRRFPGFPSTRLCRSLCLSAVPSMNFSVQISTLRLSAQASLKSNNTSLLMKFFIFTALSNVHNIVSHCAYCVILLKASALYVQQHHWNNSFGFNSITSTKLMVCGLCVSSIVWLNILTDINWNKDLFDLHIFHYRSQRLRLGIRKLSIDFSSSPLTTI